MVAPLLLYDIARFPQSQNERAPLTARFGLRLGSLMHLAIALP